MGLVLQLQGHGPGDSTGSWSWCSRQACPWPPDTREDRAFGGGLCSPQTWRLWKKPQVLQGRGLQLCFSPLERRSEAGHCSIGPAALCPRPVE